MGKTKSNSAKGGDGSTGAGSSSTSSSGSSNALAQSVLQQHQATGRGGGSSTLARSGLNASEQVPNAELRSQDPNTDLASGLPKDEKAAADTFLTNARGVLGKWRKKRTSPELGFRDEAWELRDHLRTLHHQLGLQQGPIAYFHPAMRYAARGLNTASNVRFLQEIRVFNLGVLGDFKSLLGFDDLESEHTYKLEPVFEIDATGGPAGVRVGGTASRIRVHYENPVLGLKWRQLVELAGFKFGLTTSKAGGGASISGASKPSSAFVTPAGAYVPPSFFGSARYTKASGGIGGKVGALGVTAEVGGSTSGMYISDADPYENLIAPTASMLWETPWGVSTKGNVEIDEDFGDGKLGNLDAGAGVDLADMRGTLIGDAELEGQIAPPKDDNRGAFEWVPLHLARVYFETGSFTPDPKQLKILDTLAERLREGIRLIPGERVKEMFRIDFVGFHSNGWSRHDDELQEIDEREAAGRPKRGDEKRRDRLEQLKGYENEDLAWWRAEALREHLKHQVKGRDGLAWSMKAFGDENSFGESYGENPYGNESRDRRAEVRVSAKIHHTKNDRRG